MGNGELASINPQGNVNQPFYFSDISRRWHKLTYSTYPLDMALGLGYNNSAHWAGSTVADVYNLPVFNATDDYSQFVETSQRGHIHTGYGNVTTRRTFPFAGTLFTITNTYRLGAGAPYMQVDTTTSNVGTEVMWNARLWAGTRDD